MSKDVGKEKSSAGENMNSVFLESSKAMLLRGQTTYCQVCNNPLKYSLPPTPSDFNEKNILQCSFSTGNIKKGADFHLKCPLFGVIN